MGARDFESEMSRWPMDDTRSGLEPPAVSHPSRNRSETGFTKPFEEIISGTPLSRKMGFSQPLSLSEALRKVRSVSAEPYDD